MITEAEIAELRGMVDLSDYHQSRQDRLVMKLIDRVEALEKGHASFCNLVREPGEKSKRAVILTNQADPNDNGIYVFSSRLLEVGERNGA